MAHNDIRLVIQSVETAKQAVYAKFSGAATHDRGHIRLLDPEQSGDFDLSEAPTFDDRPTNFRKYSESETIVVG